MAWRGAVLQGTAGHVRARQALASHVEHSRSHGRVGELIRTECTNTDRRAMSWLHSVLANENSGVPSSSYGKDNVLVFNKMRFLTTIQGYYLEHCKVIKGRSPCTVRKE